MIVVIDVFHFQGNLNLWILNGKIWSIKNIGGNATTLFKSLLPCYERLNSEYIKKINEQVLNM